MKKIFIFSIIFTAMLCTAGAAFASQAPVANAGPDLYVSAGQTIALQGSAYDADGGSVSYYWNCNGGTISNATVLQPVFTAPSGTTQTSYLCSFTATDNTSLSASDNMTVYVNQTQTTANYLIDKKAINISNGVMTWSKTLNASPADIVAFALTIQNTGSQALHNVYVRDVLPAGLTYRGNLMVNSNLSSGADPAAGISIGTINAGEVAVVSYQAQVAPYSSFEYGSTTLTNPTTITGTELGTQTNSATIYVNKSLVSGATEIATGTTNYFLVDSFLLPMMLIILGSWLYFTGRVYRFADWLGQKM